MEEATETLEAVGQDDGDASTPPPAAPPAERKLTNWLDGYREYTELWEPPAIFNTWVGLLTLAAATQRRVWLEDANNRIYPNLFVVLVAPSGVGKTSAMREARGFIEAAISADHISPSKITGAKLLQRMSAARMWDEDAGTMSPYVIWAEELPSFLGPDSYKSGMIADLTTLYDCPDRWQKDTKNKGIDEIEAPYLCMLAGTTASGIFDVLPPGSVTQGFTARLIFVHATYNERRVVEKPYTANHVKLAQWLTNDIQIISKLKGPARFSDFARTLWTEYYLSRPYAQDEFADVRLQGYAARKPFYVKKIALLLSLAESDSLVVDAGHVERAFVLLNELDLTLRAVYEEIAPNIVIQHYGRIVRKLSKSRNGTMAHSELLRTFSYTMDAQEFTKAMSSLIEMGLVESGLDTRGHRAMKVYKVTKGGEKWLKSG